MKSNLKTVILRINMEQKDFPFKSFFGNDQDYGSPYRHRYNEPDSDRGSSDEGWDRPNSPFRKRGKKLW